MTAYCEPSSSHASPVVQLNPLTLACGISSSMVQTVKHITLHKLCTDVLYYMYIHVHLLFYLAKFAHRNK